jgi:hypothetical protein
MQLRDLFNSLYGSAFVAFVKFQWHRRDFLGSTSTQSEKVVPGPGLGNALERT